MDGEVGGGRKAVSDMHFTDEMGSAELLLFKIGGKGLGGNPHIQTI